MTSITPKRQQELDAARETMKTLGNLRNMLWDIQNCKQADVAKQWLKSNAHRIDQALEIAILSVDDAA
jgi:hypothetical protein